MTALAIAAVVAVALTWRARSHYDRPATMTPSARIRFPANRAPAPRSQQFPPGFDPATMTPRGKR